MARGNRTIESRRVQRDHVAPHAKVRELLLATGQRRTAWAVYNPPGDAFDFDPKVTEDAIHEWAEQQAKPYRDAGYAAEDMALFAMSDEPGWYYPQMFDPLKSNPTAMARFRDYLKSQGLTPQDVGAADWDDVLPIGRNSAKDLAGKRLFYCSKLRCAAEKGDVQFGGYVIPRTAGDREEGILQKILYLALQHANIPVDFVEEDDLSADGLKTYRVLYVTEPNVPAENQRGLVDWIHSGGTLITVSGAASHDRYNEPCNILSEATRIQQRPRERMLIANTNALPDVGTGSGAQGDFTAVGVKGELSDAAISVEAKFADGSPAVVATSLGAGQVVHFTWMPGLSYGKSSRETRDRLPVGFADSIRRWIVWPTKLADVEPPVTVDRPMVETPLLLSDSGAAITLLNWTGERIEQMAFSIRIPFQVRSVESVKLGKLPFEQTGEKTLTLAIPLDAADILLIR